MSYTNLLFHIVFVTIAVLFVLIAGGGISVAGVDEIAAVLSTDNEIDETFIAGAGFDAEVLDMAVQDDGKIVAVGRFQAPVGYPSSYIVRLDAEGNIDQIFKAGTGANNFIFRIQRLPDGKMIIGVGFTAYNGAPVKYIARINADGSLDPSFNNGSGPSASVTAFDIDALGGLIFGGSFSTVNGVPTGPVARFDAAGNLDASFGTTLTDSIAVVRVLSNGKLMVSGYTRESLVRLNANGSTDAKIFVNGPVLQIKETAAGVYISGNFTVVVSSNRRGIARLNGNAVDQSFASTSELIEIVDLAMASDGKVYVSGHMIRPDGSNASILRLNANGSDDRVMLVNAVINRMVIEPDGTLVAAGMRNEGIRRLNGPYNSGIIKLDQNGEVLPNYMTRTAAGFYGSVKVSQLPDGKMLAWGDYWPDRRGLVRLTRDGLVDDGYDPPLTEYFAAAALRTDGTAYVGGHDEGNDQTFRIRRVLADGTIDLTFNAAGRWTRNDGSGNLKDLAVQLDGRVIAVGNFVEINGQARLNIVRLMPDGSLDTTFSFTPSTWDIYKIEIDQRSGRIFIGARTTAYSGATTIYELASDGAIIWQARLESSYDALRGLQQTADGDLLVTGYFTRIHSQNVTRIARLNSDGTLDEGFTAPTLVAEYRGFNAAFELPDGRIMVGGTFWNIPTVRDVGYVKRLFRDGSIDPSFSMTLTCSNSCIEPVKTFARQPDGKLIVSGSFEFANGSSKHRNVRLQPFEDLFTISGRVVTPDGRALRNAVVTLIDSTGARSTVITSSLGYYTFSDVASGSNYTVGVSSKRYRFTRRTMDIYGNLANLDFIGLE